MESIETKIIALKEMSVFAMSLGSHELFHSNMWAWIINNYDKEGDYAFTRFFFPKIFNVKYSDIVITAKREHKNRDIVIEVNGFEYVIENKFKSIPTLEQLKGYSNETKFSKFFNGVLTGLAEPLFDLPEGWNFISYKKIAEKLIKISDKKTDLNSQIIKQYAESLKLESEIIESFVKEREGFWDMSQFWYKENPVFEKIEDIRLGDICKKQKALSLEKYIKENIELDYKSSTVIEKSDEFKLYIWSYFYNKQPVVDIRYVRTRDKKDGKSKQGKPTQEELLIGIQIQGNQYRKFVQMHNGNIEDKEGKIGIFNEFINKEWFDGKYKKGDSKIFEKTTSQRDKYCKYEVNGERSYRFVYQYWNIDDMSYKDLLEVIKEDLVKVRELLHDFDYKD